MPRTKCASHSLFSPSRRLKTALIWTLAICSGETFCSLSEMLGHELVLAIDDAGVVPAGVHIGNREVLLDLARAASCDENDEDEAGRQPSAACAELYIAHQLDIETQRAGPQAGSRGPAISVLARLDLLPGFLERHSPGAERTQVAALSRGR